MKIKGKMIAFVIIAMLIITIATPVQAVYQSIKLPNKDSYSKLYNYDAIKNIRRMEEEGKGMGLKETLKEDNSLISVESNNIDVHFMKNTEYGAIALLSASPKYGKQGTGTDRYVANGKGLNSSTGNPYGVYFNLSVITSSIVKEGRGYIANSNVYNRYIDLYNSEYGPAKEGDAMLNWHSANGVRFPYFNNSAVRCYDVERYGMFSSYGNNYGAIRAAAVCGIGF